MLETGNGRGRRYTELRKDDLVRERKTRLLFRCSGNKEAR
jgi:hypothetical protein